MRCLTSPGVRRGELDAISNAIYYAKFRSRSHDAVIRVYDEAGNVIETHEHAASSESGEPIVFGISSQTKGRHAVSADRAGTFQYPYA
jgi:hypothetical protein